jgi:hypothetical protein
VLEFYLENSAIIIFRVIVLGELDVNVLVIKVLDDEPRLIVRTYDQWSLLVRRLRHAVP